MHTLGGQETFQNVNAEIYQGLYHWLENYVQKMESPNLTCRNQFDFKYRHTLRVVNEMVMLGVELHLSDRELLLAKTIALLHDVGRFEQFKRYETYNDHISIDHGALGVDIIKENNLLTDFDGPEQNCIHNAILWHNKPSLSKEQKGVILFFSKLIRDADKLDILRINLEKMEAMNSNKDEVPAKLSEDVSAHIFQGLMQERSIHYGELGNETDLVLARIGWIFDLNFIPTFSRYAQRNYFEAFASILPVTPRVMQVLAKAQVYLDRKCATVSKNCFNTSFRV